MSKRLFVGNLTQHLTDKELGELFASYGGVLKAEVVRGRGGRSRRFGYVELTTDDSAARAIAELNGREINGQAMTLAEARSAAPRKAFDEDEHRSGPFRGHGPGGGGGGGGGRGRRY
jgi:RNA recognition motif-containing protein